MLKAKQVIMVDVGDWDNLVTETYGRPYDFQQQDGCKERGIFNLTVPSGYDCDFKNLILDDMTLDFYFWKFVHNALIHPLLAFPWEGPQWLLDAHDWTAERCKGAG